MKTGSGTVLTVRKHQNQPSEALKSAFQEFDSLDENDRQVILAKAEGTGPSVPGGVHGFPTSSVPAPRRPVRSGYTPKICPRVPPKVVNQGQGLGAGANPAGAGGGGENPQFDESGTCPAPNKEQSQESSTHHHDFTQKKKKRNQQKNAPRKINEKFESKAVKKLVKKALHNQDVKKEYDRIKKRIEEGVNPINIGVKSTSLTGTKVLIKGVHVHYVVEVSKDQVHVLGIGARRNNRNMQNFQFLMNEMYDLNLQY